MTPGAVDAAFVTETLIRLVQTNSVNPDLETDGPGEAAIGACIAEILRSLDMDVIVDEPAPGRPNVTGIMRGRGTPVARNLMLNGHMDTVGVAGMSDPFLGHIEDGMLYGRGSYDMKSGLAAMLGAAKALHDAGTVLEGDLILSFVADEEYESLGAQALAARLNDDSSGLPRAHAAIVTEPTDLHICPAHRGFAVFRITSFGRTAHGGQHRTGIDANMNMGLVLARLHGLARELTTSRRHPLCGEASLHVPLVEGGRSLFIYSHECHIMVERRTLPGESKASVTAELQGILDAVAALEPTFRATLELEMWRSPWEIDASADIVQSLARASRGVEHTREGFIGHGWWEDSAIFGEAGIPSVVMGATGGGIHQDEEWVEVDSVVSLAEVLRRTAIDYCGQV